MSQRNQWMVRLACLSLLLTGATAGLWGQDQESDAPQIRTTGESTQYVRPDQASLTLNLTAIDSTPARAGARVALRADSVRRALVALGIPRDSLLTGSKYYWWPDRIRPLPSGWHCVPLPGSARGCTDRQDTLYLSREAIEVRVSDLTKVGAVIDAALALGITDISTIRFSAWDVSAAQKTALREATNRAREQADVIAAAAGVRVGKTLALSTQAEYTNRWSITTLGSVQGDMTGGGGRTEITFPSLPVKATVFGRWAIQDR